MKTFTNYIYESLNDNLIWLLDKWFERHENEKQEFIELLVKVKKDNSIQNVEKYINETTTFKETLKEFVNFINDDISIISNENDYIYLFKEIIKILINNKSNKNTYIKL